MLDEHQSKEPNKQQRVMKKSNLETMSVDDLWSLHEEISGILSARITSEKRELEKFVNSQSWPQRDRTRGCASVREREW
jgi:hypothetical protein